MLQKIYDYIRQNSIIGSGDSVLVGISGGADSVCLFLILQKLRETIGFELEAIHVEHGIRGGESQRDANFTMNLCQRNNVACHIRHVDVPDYARSNGLGEEEAARILRYNIFSEYAKKNEAKVAIAHHQEDNAETILFQMIRGSGLHGMTGIKPIRYDEEGVCYIRPLLCVSRGEIEEFLAQSGQAYCTDSTNLCTEYNRNKIRQLVLPEFEKINQKAVEHINQTARRLSVVEDYIALRVKDAIEEVLTIQTDDTRGGTDAVSARTDDTVDGPDVECAGAIHKYIIDVMALTKLHSAIRDECILEIIGMAAGRKKDIGIVHVQQILELCDSQSGKSINLPYDIIAYKEYDRIVLTKVYGGSRRNSGQYDVSYDKLETEARSLKGYWVDIDESGESFCFKVFAFDGDLKKIPQKPYTKWLCYDKIKNGLLLRKRESGDYYISDASGHKKKLKEYFINEKIPASARDNIWLLANGKEIAIIFGTRISENYKVDADTKEILEVHYNGGKNDGFFKEV